jgi:hypothetical protein
METGRVRAAEGLSKLETSPTPGPDDFHRPEVRDAPS